MLEPLRHRPDVLVLAAGGTLGEAWMRGLLHGIEAGSGVDFRDCEYFVGTSAGSIVAAVLAAGRRPEAGGRVAERWAQAVEGNGRAPADEDGPGLLRQAASLGLTATSPLVPFALTTGAPPAAAVRAVALNTLPRPQRTIPGLAAHIERAGARFDGRLRIVAVDRRNGKRVVFGAPGAPAARPSEAVLASCAIPWVFAPVRIGDREYVDGGVWSPTNLDATPVGRGTQVLCLNPTASLDAARSVFGALRAVSRAAELAESLALRARGATVRTIAPDADSAGAMGANLMDRGRLDDVLEAAYVQGRRLA